VTEVPEDLPVASFRGWHPAVTEIPDPPRAPSGGVCSRCGPCRDRVVCNQGPARGRTRKIQRSSWVT